MAVTITTLLPPSGIAQLALSSFRDAAKKGEMLQVVHDGSIWNVWACDTTGTERLGARPDSEVDTTSIFADALGRAFSRGIQDAVVRELGLAPNPGQPLASRLAQQAIAMAETSQQALQGVDFMTQLMFSAAARGEEFVAACRALGLAPEAVSAQQRAAIDVCMQERFAQAAQQGQFPVAPALARQWLQVELTALRLQAPGAR